MVQFVTLPGLANYEETIKVMEDKVGQVINKRSPEIIYLIEYKEVYSAGTSFKQEELLNSGGIPVIYTNRGGKFTYHGMGQRVIYPILDLSISRRQKDLKLYIRLLEEWIISSLSHFGIRAFTIKDMVGVWVQEKGAPSKIASIGVRIKKWVTYHGIAINISPDLEKFKGIIACGLKGFPTTSLQKLGINISLGQFDRILKKNFYKFL